MLNENSALAKSLAMGVFTSSLLVLPSAARARPGRLLPAHLLLALAAVSAAASPSRSFALMSFLPTLTLWVLACGSTALAPADLKKMVPIAAVIPVAVGALQAAGLDPTPWQEVARGTFHGRVCSMLGNPNFFAAWLVAVVPFCAWLAAAPGPAPARAAGAALAALGLFGLVHSGSKGGLLGAATAAAAAFLTARRAGFVSAVPRRAVAWTAGGIALLLVIGLLTLPPVVRARLLLSAPEDSAPAGGGGIASNESVRFRLLTWKQSLLMVRGAPLTGHGLGRFQVAYPAWRLPEIIRMFGQHSYMTDHPENIALEATIETGLAGLGLFLWLLAGVGRALLFRVRAGTPAERGFAVCASASLVGLFVTNSVGLDIHYGATAVLAACIAGAALAPFRLSPSGGGPGRVPRAGLVAAALLLSLAWVRVWASDAGLGRAIALSQAGRWDGALAWYRHSRMLNPFNVITRYFGASAYMDRGNPEDLERARELFETVRREAPDYVLLNYKLYLLHSKIGNEREAAEFLARQTKLDPVAAVFHLDRGRMAMQAGDWKEAELQFRKAVEAEPANPSGYQYLGNLLVVRGRHREALAVYATGLEKAPSAIELHYNSAVAAYKMGNRALARKHAEETLRLDPANRGALIILEKLR